MTRRSRVIVGVFGALATMAVVATVAVATHPLNFTYSVSPTKVGAITTTTVKAQLDDASTAGVPTDMAFHLDPGAQIAYADDATSPLSPPPINGDKVGTATITADPSTDGCGNPMDITADATWVDPVSSDAPANTVAEAQVTSTILFTTYTQRVFVVKSAGDSYQAAAHHDLTVLPDPDLADQSLCAGTGASVTVTVDGKVSGTAGKKTRIIQKNPKTVGTKTVYGNYTDANGVHSGSATYEVTRR